MNVFVWDLLLQANVETFINGKNWFGGGETIYRS